MKLQTRKIYLNNIPLEEARDMLQSALREEGYLSQEETISVIDALGRVTAKPAFAKLSAPYFTASAMDGYAVKAESTYEADERNPVRLKIHEDCWPVDTGDPMVDPCNAVIMIEDVTTPQEGCIEILRGVSPWENVRAVGEDIVVGEMILPASHCITPVDIGAMLSGGVTEIVVVKRPKVALLPTGTEIVEPGQPMEVGKIVESNSRVFEAIVKECGGEPVRLPPVVDDYTLIRDMVRSALDTCDMVVINAGSSAGSEDYTAAIIAELGRVLVHGLAIKPGKPAILGIAHGKPVVGIPGYPVSAWIVFEELVKPLVYSYLQRAAAERIEIEAIASKRMVSSLKHREYVRVKLGKVGPRLVATPLNRGAGATMSLVRADGLLVIPQNSEGVESGEKVKVQLMRDIKEIERTVVVIGSHDLVLDLISDEMHCRWPGSGLSSAHVGSMGGLMALKRGEAHIAPIHLLDENTGEYNVSFVRRYFADKEMVLIKGVRRVQGIMVPMGNPKKITSLACLRNPEISMVNRQKGSGTRILLDYQLKKLGITGEQITGYHREMTTHMAVASAVASGTADAGMGIESAARAMGLAFIPVGVEEYDFVALAEFVESESIVHFIEVLSSNQLRERLVKMGGYAFDSPGAVVPIENGCL